MILKLLLLDLAMGVWLFCYTVGSRMVEDNLTKHVMGALNMNYNKSGLL